MAAGGDDVVRGGPGDDELIGNVGDDTLIDRHGSNTISDGSASPSDETGLIVTGNGHDYVHLGFYGRFTVRAGGGVDHIAIDPRVATANVFAGAGNDTVQLKGDDYGAGVVVRLQDGNDTLECTQACAGDAMVYGGPGSNLIDTQAAGPVTITLGHGGVGARAEWHGHRRLQPCLDRPRRRHRHRIVRRRRHQDSAGRRPHRRR